MDYWDGHNWTCGSAGRHEGLTKLNEEFVLIHGTQWQGEKEYAEIITEKEAVQRILGSGNTELFNEYPELQTIREALSNKEKAVIIMKINAGEKKRWQGRAELEKLSLTKLIQKAMNKYLK